MIFRCSLFYCQPEVTECDDVEDIDYKFGETDPFGEEEELDFVVKEIKMAGTPKKPQFKSAFRLGAGNEEGVQAKFFYIDKFGKHSDNICKI